MSVDFRTRNALLLAAVQSGAGSEASPVPGSNAVRIADQIGYSPAFDVSDNTNFVEGSISDSARIIGGVKAMMKLSTFLSPATVAGNAGDPDYGVLLSGCALAETKFSGDGFSGAAVSGATSNTVSWSSGTAGTDGQHIGRVLRVLSGTGVGQFRVITAYVAASRTATVYPNWTVVPDVTSLVGIAPSSRYVPQTTALSLLTLWGYQHSSISGNSSRLRRLMDAMGTCQLSVKPRGLAKLDFTFSGVMPATPSDVSKPASATFLGIDPAPLSGALSYLNGVATKFTDFSLDIGNTVAQFDDPTAAYGYDSADVPSRDVTGTLTPALVPVATRGTTADALAMTNIPFWLAWSTGSTIVVGKSISVFIPSLRWTDVQADDAGGFQVEKLKFDAGGLDSEVYINIF